VELATQFVPAADEVYRLQNLQTGTDPECRLFQKFAEQGHSRLAGVTQTELELKPDPLLRWSNPAVGSIHGAVFVWTHEGRPAAVASIYKWFEPHTHMAFEVHSLSKMPLIGFLGEQPL
jgi:hypothetical protein